MQRTHQMLRHALALAFLCTLAACGGSDAGTGTATGTGSQKTDTGSTNNSGTNSSTSQSSQGNADVHFAP